jgi:hypothetical protein
LEGFNSNDRDEVSNTVVCYHDQSNYLPAKEFEMFSYQNNSDVMIHDSSEGPRVNEFSFSHGDVLYFVGMKYL